MSWEGKTIINWCWIQIKFKRLEKALSQFWIYNIKFENPKIGLDYTCESLTISQNLNDMC